MLLKAILGLVGMSLAIAFYAVPLVKLKDTAMIIVVLVGVAMMVYEFIESLREKD